MRDKNEIVSSPINCRISYLSAFTDNVKLDWIMEQAAFHEVILSLPL